VSVLSPLERRAQAHLEVALAHVNRGDMAAAALSLAAALRDLRKATR
jgi:hypothetical protein